ncbi:MAG: nitroreductase family deazaflavin-dependent oxidoreductase [Pseudomonadota bacterium]|jgi:deazaflavin-dependent oxidoreductase (nitroreductase family)
MAEKIDVEKVLSDPDFAKYPDWIKTHLRTYLESGGEEGHLWPSGIKQGEGPAHIPTLLLTTVGRKSGKQRILPLLYGKVGSDHIIIGSMGGAPKHPQWFLNLQANPDAEIQVGTDHYKVRARIAEGQEREKIWSHMLTIFPVYGDYQKKTERRIPVVVLEKQA